MSLFKAALPACCLLRTISKRSQIVTCPIGCSRTLYTSNSFLKISEEVLDALKTEKPVVALETTIYTHGWSTQTLQLMLAHVR